MGLFLDDLHVVPDLKGQGLGRQLMTAVAEQVWRSNPSGRFIYSPTNKIQGRRFYERLGGVVTLRHAELAPDGTEVNVVRYCWSELSGLAGRRI